jgi:late competence protein required for DNA uptake (superfamily II DNA/RNA helicase)
MSTYEDLIKKVHEKANEFNGHLTKVKGANDALIARSGEVLQALTELVGTVRETKTCSVCYTRDQKVALVPCGHVFCSSCADRGRRSRCHTCRQPVEDLMRVFT